MKKEVGSKGTSSGALKYFKSATKDELQKEKAFVHMKKMEDKLRYYKQMVIDSNNAILIQDFKGTIKAWNPGATKLYHFTTNKKLRIYRYIYPVVSTLYYWGYGPSY